MSNSACHSKVSPNGSMPADPTVEAHSLHVFPTPGPGQSVRVAGHFQRVVDIHVFASGQSEQEQYRLGGEESVPTTPADYSAIGW